MSMLNKMRIQRLRDEVNSRTFKMMPKGYQLRIYDELESLYREDLEADQRRRDKVSEALNDRQADIEQYLIDSEGE